MSVTSVSSDAYSSAYDPLNESEVQETNPDRKNIEAETNAVAVRLLSSPKIKPVFMYILGGVETIYAGVNEMRIGINKAHLEIKQVCPESINGDFRSYFPESSIPGLIEDIKKGENVMDKLVGLALTLRYVSEDLKLFALENVDTVAKINLFIQEYELGSCNQRGSIGDNLDPLMTATTGLAALNMGIAALTIHASICIQNIRHNVHTLGIDKKMFLTLVELCDCALKLQRCFGDESGSCDQHQSVKEALALLRPAAAHLREIKGGMQDSAHYVAEISEKLAAAETVEEAIAILNQYGGSVAILKNVKPLSIKNPLGSVFSSLVYAHDTPKAERVLEVERIAAELSWDYRK